jgi:hypothetical protein
MVGLQGKIRIGKIIIRAGRLGYNENLWIKTFFDKYIKKRLPGGKSGGV